MRLRDMAPLEVLALRNPQTDRNIQRSTCSVENLVPLVITFGIQASHPL